MKPLFPEGKIHFGQNVRLVVQNDRCSVYKIQNPTGDGVMTSFQMLPGMILMHCDMHMSQYLSDLQVNTEMFSIDHCREGRMECCLTNGQSFCLDAGTSMVHTADGIMPEFFCPTSHYHGLTLVFFLEEAQESIATLFSGVEIDLRLLRDKFCGGKPPILLPKEKMPCSLFSLLYELPQNDDWQLHRLKILELLLYFGGLDISGIGERPYFYKTKVEKVKAIERYMMENLGAAHTIEGLSARFGFPLTSMKLCFKGVFGSTIYAYLRNQRMSAAAKRLRESRDRVAVVAASVGYENASKFAVAFRACMGKSPHEYRKQTTEFMGGEPKY
ncbi:MAG: AraC family transcriptional regulator [Clostridiales bacterium]|nr:AraC family transcriptional regulator [Clostridiales bacterium]